MSMHLAQAVIGRMNLQPAMLAPSYCDFMGAMRMFATADAKAANEAAESARADLVAAYGYQPQSQNKPFAFANGVAIIPVHGALINRFGGSWGFITGYNFIRSQLNAAVADPEVEMVVFDMNSGGGEVAGCFELVDDIYNARSEKPTLAVVDSNCYSACYALASAAQKVVVTPTGGAGSIGVVATHVNMQKMLAEAGYEITFIFSGDHKVDGNSYEALPADVKANIQASVDKTRQQFVNLVARNRGLDAKTVYDTQAECYRAEDALRIGLIDAVQSPNEAVASFFNELTGSDDPQESDPMSDEAKTKPGASQDPVNTDAVKAEAVSTERQRINGILNCEEASEKGNLARELALETDLSVDAAKKILKAAAPEKAQTAATQAVDSRADLGSGAFREAMNNSRQPNVGADAEGNDGGGADPNDPKSKAARILANQAAATGRRLTK